MVQSQAQRLVQALNPADRRLRRRLSVLLGRVEKAHLPLPSARWEDGSVHLYWYTDHHDLEIEVQPGGAILFLMVEKQLDAEGDVSCHHMQEGVMSSSRGIHDLLAWTLLGSWQAGQA